VWSGPREPRAREPRSPSRRSCSRPAGCGGGGRRDAGAADRTYTVEIVRTQFPKRQHLGDDPGFVIAVRNAGDTTIRTSS